MKNLNNQQPNITEVMMSFQGLSHTQARSTFEYEVLTSSEQMLVDMMYEEGDNL